MRTKLLILGLLFAVLCFYSLSYSQVPQMINYQGKLTKPSGALLDTTVTVRFAIYGDTLGEPHDGAYWSETQFLNVKNGVFSVLLGSVNPIPDTVFTGEPRYLATKIGSDPEMKPLRPMASVPYALYAFKSLGGKGDGDWFVNGNDMYSIPSGNVGIGTTAPTAGLDVKHSSNTEYALKVYNSGGQALGVEVTGGANSATPLLNVHSGYSGGDRQGLWVQSDGNVGIGTTNPHGLLQVGEPFIVTADEDVGISHASDPEYTPDAKLEIVREANKDLLMLGSTAAANGNLLIVKNDGNVGIGTATPNNKLTVFQETEVQASTYPGAKISVRQMNGEPEYGHPEKNYALELNDRSTGSTAGVAMKLSSGNGPIANIYSTANAVGYGGSLVFQTSPDHSNLFDRVTINSSGYVGIGNTDPHAKLEVGDGDLSNLQGTVIGHGGSVLPDGIAPTDGVIGIMHSQLGHIAGCGVLGIVFGPVGEGVRGKGPVGVSGEGAKGVWGEAYDAGEIWGSTAGVYGKAGTAYSRPPLFDMPSYGIYGKGAGVNTYGVYSAGDARVQGALTVTDNVGIGTTNPDAKLTVKGKVDGSGKTLVMRGYDESGELIVEIGKGLDYSESFPISQEDIAPGMVMVIDPANKGNLAMSTEAYDSKVAGIIAGANGLGSGVRLGSRAEDAGQHAVALAGRVYCNVDTKYGDIKPGDLLTTSPTPGYAMVVKDFSRAQGAILGKAMEGLSGGEKGQILVLVTLQ